MDATRLSISGPLGDDVTFVSATVIDSVVPSEMLRRYPLAAKSSR